MRNAFWIIITDYLGSMVPRSSSTGGTCGHIQHQCRRRTSAQKISPFESDAEFICMFCSNSDSKDLLSLSQVLQFCDTPKGLPGNERDKERSSSRGQVYALTPSRHQPGLSVQVAPPVRQIGRQRKRLHGRREGGGL